MNDFTKDELIERAAQLFIVVTHNLEQEEKFKAGTPCMPKVKNYEEYCQLYEMMNKVFSPPFIGMKFADISPSKIVYDIPERFRNE